MTTEEEIVETPQQEYTNDVQADLEAAIKEVEGRDRDEEGRFVAKEEKAEPAEAVEEQAPTEPVKQLPEPPQSWSAEAKAEWAGLSERARAEVLKRETDMHQALTRHDGELNLGRQLKSAIAPYEAQIRAEGATPIQAVESLLNTAYILRSGSPEQKKAILINTAKQYGIDIGAVHTEEEYVDPTIAQLKAELNELKRVADPAYIRSTLTQEMESTKIQSDIVAFASDPAHIHFPTVKPLMASILGAGQAKDLKEAYDMACMANPSIRSTLEAAKNAELEAKRKQDIQAKKRAASSVTGSPATPSNSKATNPKSSVEDDLRAAFDELETRV